MIGKENEKKQRGKVNLQLVLGGCSCNCFQIELEIKQKNINSAVIDCKYRLTKNESFMTSWLHSVAQRNVQLQHDTYVCETLGLAHIFEFLNYFLAKIIIFTNVQNINYELLE